MESTPNFSAVIRAQPLGDERAKTKFSWTRGPLLGQGAFGAVSVALNRETGCIFAVKTVELDRSPSELAALENEVSLLRVVNSPRVVRCLGADWTREEGVAKRNLFLEYAPGGSLADVLKRFGGGLEERLLRIYSRGITEGLRDLHALGIMHCDVKGQNVVLAEGDTGVKLCDLGAAAWVGRGHIHPVSTADGAVTASRLRGTICWMAPEVVREEEQGLEADIWSLGCTIIELATGAPPWGVIDPFSALYKIGCSEATPEIPPGLSSAAHNFLQLCLQRNPHLRPSAQELLDHPFLTEPVPITMSSVTTSLTTTTSPESPSSVFGFQSWESYTANFPPSPPSSPPSPSPSGAELYLSASPSFVASDAPDTLGGPGNTLGLDLEALDIPDTSGDNCHSFGSNSSDCSKWSRWSSPNSPPPGQWITVHSPRATSTTSEAPQMQDVDIPGSFWPSSPSGAATSDSHPQKSWDFMYSHCDQEEETWQDSSRDLITVSGHVPPGKVLLRTSEFDVAKILGAPPEADPNWDGPEEAAPLRRSVTYEQLVLESAELATSDSPHDDISSTACENSTSGPSLPIQVANNIIPKAGGNDEHVAREVSTFSWTDVSPLLDGIVEVDEGAYPAGSAARLPSPESSPSEGRHNRPLSKAVAPGEAKTGYTRSLFSAKGAAKAHHRGASCPPVLEFFCPPEADRLGSFPAC